MTAPTILANGARGVTVSDLTTGVLLNEHQYYFAVRATDVFGDSLIGRSMGVLVLEDKSLPLPGRVFDGPTIGTDVSYQTSTSYVDVSWTPFGNGTGTSHQQIAFYEVAVGTSVLSPAGRTNVAPYRRVELSDVELDESIAFTYRYEGLELIPGNTTYFVTVRAEAESGVTLFVSSSGVVAGWTEVPTAGNVTLFPFQASTASMVVAWSSFQSKIPLAYSWAIGSGVRGAELSGECEGHAPSSPSQNIRPFTAVGRSTAAIASGLSLVSGQAYFVTVQARDAAGNCVQTASTSTVVDATAPIAGQLLVHGRTAAGSGLDNKAVYVPDADTLQLAFPGFSDPESGIESYLIEITAAASCAVGDVDDITVILPTSQLPWKVTQANLTQLNLQADVPYTVSLTAVNRAGTHTRLDSVPVLLDVSAMAAGHVNDGTVLNADVVFQAGTTSMTGIFTQVFSPDQVCHSLLREHARHG